MDEIRELANGMYNPDIVSLTDKKIKIPPSSKKLWDDPKKAHIYAVICASLQYKFWYGDSSTRIDNINSQWINDMVKEELDHCNVAIQDLKPLLIDRLIESNIPKLDERLKSLDEIFSLDLDLYGYYYKSNKTSMKLLQGLPSFKKDPFFKKGLFALIFSERLRGVTSNLPVPADYQIPKILEDLDILEYSVHLKGMIEADTVIPEGSKYEVAIRAATIIACDKLAEYNDITPGEVDLWLFKQKNSSKSKHHLCDTTNY